MIDWKAWLGSRRARRLVAGAGLSMVLGVSALAATPALVKERVRDEGLKRGLDVQVESVRVGARGIWLRGVHAALRPESEAEPSAIALQANFDSVLVEVWRGGAVTANGGLVRARGAPDALRKRLSGDADAGESETRRGSGRRWRLQGTGFRYDHEALSLAAFGVTAERGENQHTLHVDLMRATAGSLAVTGRDAEVAVSSASGRRRLKRIGASAVAIELRASPNETTEPSPAADVPVSRLDRVRSRRTAALALLSDVLDESAELTLDSVTARIARGGEALSIGPDRLGLARAGDVLTVNLTPHAGAEPAKTPLAFSARVPLRGGATELSLRGGPVSFATLGLKPGELGVTDVQRAELSADGKATFSDDLEVVTFEGRIGVRGVGLLRKRLSPRPFGPIAAEASVVGRGRTDGSDIAIDSADVSFGGLKVQAAGKVALAGPQVAADVQLRIPLATCQSLLDSVPRGLAPLLEGVELSGNFSASLGVEFDSMRRADTDVVLRVQNECRVRRYPEALSPERFEQPFVREVESATGEIVAVETGPGSPSWVPIEDISPHLETAVLICEDAQFFKHDGFDFGALESALRDDIKAGKFVRGGSTLSMQLAKNLYLEKEKTIARKLQEAVFTTLLEQHFDKRHLLELYFNVVEFGPGLYGIGPAAQYYFAKPARDLSLGQALYLASILPNPSQSHFAPDGKLTPKWAQYLHKLMHIAKKIRRIDEQELAAALAEEIAFRVPGDSPFAHTDEPPDFEPPGEEPLGL